MAPLMASFHSDMAELIWVSQAELRTAGYRALLVTADKLGELGNRKGAYLLALHLPRAVPPGTTGRSSQFIDPGCHIYAGSAYGPGGLHARLRRHLNPAKTVHWHVDRLTTNADDMAALAVPDGRECRLVEALLGSRQFRIAVPGFGSTDCRNCEGHLLAAGARGSEAERFAVRRHIAPRFRAD
jgi:Uri superfamily endonuclease